MSRSLKLCLVALLNKPGVTVGRRGVRLNLRFSPWQPRSALYAIMLLPEFCPPCSPRPSCIAGQILGVDGVAHHAYRPSRNAALLVGCQPMAS